MESILNFILLAIETCTEESEEIVGAEIGHIIMLLDQIVI